MKLQIAKTKSEIEKVSKVLLQLRTGYTLEDINKQIRLQQQNGYQVAYIEFDGKVICVAGFVVGFKLAWGKHIHIDDLITDERYRSKGAGKFMMNWIKSFALENECEQIHLNSGLQRLEAHRFYLREGFNIVSHHFSIADLNTQ